MKEPRAKVKRHVTKVKPAKADVADVTAGAEVEVAKGKERVESEVKVGTAKAEAARAERAKAEAARAEENVSESTGFKRSACAVASSLDLVGDKWSLLVVRDLLYGKRTYGELADSPEGIPTNILADRLKRLESAGIISSAAYQERPVRYAYTLTKKGVALGDVLIALVRWGKEHIPGTRSDGGRS